MAPAWKRGMQKHISFIRIFKNLSNINNTKHYHMMYRKMPNNMIRKIVA